MNNFSRELYSKLCSFDEYSSIVMSVNSKKPIVIGICYQIKKKQIDKESCMYFEKN